MPLARAPSFRAGEAGREGGMGAGRYVRGLWRLLGEDPSVNRRSGLLGCFTAGLCCALWHRDDDMYPHVFGPGSLPAAVRGSWGTGRNRGKSQLEGTPECLGIVWGLWGV